MEVKALPSAKISGAATVCKNGSSPVITITASGGKAPYTIHNTINVSNITISASTTANTISASGDVTTSAGNMSDQKGEVRTVPANTQASTYTLVASDHGKVIIASDTITLPAGIFSTGQTISIYNNTASDISINRSSVTMYWVTDGTDADRTLATRGVATILCVGTNTFVITGGLLT